MFWWAAATRIHRYLSHHQTAPPAQHCICHRALQEWRSHTNSLWKYLTRSLILPETCEWLSARPMPLCRLSVCNHEGYQQHREENIGNILLGRAALQKPRATPSSFNGLMAKKLHNKDESIIMLLGENNLENNLSHFLSIFVVPSA